MAVTRPSPATQPGSLHSGNWWDAEEFDSIRQNAAPRQAADDLASPEILCHATLELARYLRNPKAQIGYLSTVGSSWVQRFQYRSALEAYLDASLVAEAARDSDDFGAISGHLSKSYLQVGDLPSALNAAERGRAATQNLLPEPFCKAQLLLRLGRMHERTRDEAVAGFFLNRIDAARQQQDDLTLEQHSWNVVREARAWDLPGMEQLADCKLAKAETALTEALRLRTLFEQIELAFSYWHLGRLRLGQACLIEAERFTDGAIRTTEAAGHGAVVYVLVHQCGRIREVSGQTEEALDDLGVAVETAAKWRREPSPAGFSLTAATVEGDGQLLESFVDSAARQALRAESPSPAGQAFLALELNWASPRESKALAEAWRKKLPLAFWETLGKLRGAQTRRILTIASADAETEGLNLELSEMEAVSGLGLPPNIAENFRRQRSLTHFQKGLGHSESVLSFILGESESYLWAVTKSSLRVYRLPGREVVRSEAMAFRNAVVRDPPEAEDVGERLYQEVFEELAPRAAGKSARLLSRDGSLFELHFAALVVGRGDGKAVYTVEKHSLQMMPGALLLSRGTVQPASRYLAVEDPIYKFAHSVLGPAPLRGPPGENANENLGQLNSVPASRQEVDGSRRNWRRGEVRKLERISARKNTFLRPLLPVPSVTRLMTQILAPSSHRDHASRAFSQGTDGRPELLGTAYVATRVPGSVVVMTGCSNARAEVRAGAGVSGTGVSGLARAWLVAGSSTVVATGWPVADSPGELPEFYRHLAEPSNGEAPRRSQVEMRTSGTRQATPSYSASFQVVGGTR